MRNKIKIARSVITKSKNSRSNLIVFVFLLTYSFTHLLTFLYAFETEKFFSIQSKKYVNVVKGEVLVKFKKGTEKSKRTLAHKNINAQIKGGLDAIGVEVIKIPEGMSVQQAIEYYKSLPDVEYVEPNLIRRPLAVFPNDTYYTNQWALPKISAPDAWEKTTGTNTIIVAVIDTGVDYTHPDLKVNVDSTTGYDFANNDLDAMDDNGHGTHVAGIIGAVGNNGIGIAGVCWSVKIMPLKVFKASGESNSMWISSAIIYAVNNSAKVINMSLGDISYPPESSQTESDACRYAYDNKVIIVAASGNGYDTDGDGKIDTEGIEPVTYPAAYEYVIAVGATSKDDKRVSYSNYGSALDLVAPGGGGIVEENWILSTYSMGTSVSQGYAYMMGTSMASPHVAGAVALLLSKNLNLTFSDIYTKLTESADDVETSGKDIYTGYGRLNIAMALGYSFPVVKAKPKNAPNPFNPKREITKIYVPQDLRGNFLKVRIYNIAGELIREINSGVLTRAE
ncbi:MAG: S8 family peptidase, partial [Endomicrobiia bacterium]